MANDTDDKGQANRTLEDIATSIGTLLGRAERKWRESGASEKIESFISLMLPLGLVEVSRTGVVAISRGAEGM